MKYLLFFICFASLAQAADLVPLKLEAGKKGNFIFEADPKSMVTGMDIVLKAGSIHDPKGKEGLTRITSLAILRGTTQKNRVQFVEELEGLGASIDIDAGASRTMIKLNVINENLAPALKLVSEALLTPAFSPSEVTSLISEEMGKLETERSNNRQLLRRAYRQAMYGGSPLAFPPEGTPASLKSLTVDDLKAQWQKIFVSGNIIWTAATNQDEKRIKELLLAVFPKIPEGAALATPMIAAKEIKGRQLYIVPRTGASTTETIIGHPGIKASNPDRVILDAGMFIFGSDFTSRLPTVLRKENGWTYGAYASYEMVDLPRRYGGFFSVYTFPQTQFATKAVPKAVELLEAYIKSGITKDELEFTKNSLGNSYAFRLATAHDRLSGRVYEMLDGAPFLSVAEYRRKMASLSREKILKAVQATHNPKNLVMVVVGDPEELKALAELVPGVTSTQIIADPMAPL